MERAFPPLANSTTPKPFRIWHLFGKNHAALFKIFDKWREIIFEDIISQNHCHVIFVNEGFAENKSVREPSRNLLDFKIEMYSVILEN